MQVPAAHPAIPQHNLHQPGEWRPDEREWLLTNGLGGFAMGTLSGVPTRRYHAWLVASRRPPLDRVVALHSIADRVRADGQDHWLASYRFQDGSPGPGAEHAESVPRDDAWEATWRIGHEGRGRITRTLRLVRGANRAEVTYRWSGLPVGSSIHLRLLAPLRDFHALERAPEALAVEPSDGSLEIRRGETRLRVEMPTGVECKRTSETWCALRYDAEHDRGYDYVEDLPAPIELGFCPESVELGEATFAFELLPEADGLETHTPASDRLARAANDFVVRRGPSPDRTVSWSILAGYPWFSDWGRDTMIALPGLLLVDGRFDEALAVLCTFADARHGGLIPNRFSDSGHGAEYNTADASLWFLHASTQWAIDSGRTDEFLDLLMPACEDIIDHHVGGTGGFDGFRIAVDPEDGLIEAGDDSTQLTWMDARRDGVVFTPRAGKPIELSALWCHGLTRVAGLTQNVNRARDCKQRAMIAARSVREKYFDASRGWCADRLGMDGSPVFEMRPNQLLAVSLEHAPIRGEEAIRTVDACIGALWTPRGVRTLAPDDPGYRGRFSGPIFERDAAYHQGTAWPWLLGPMCEALLRAHDFDQSSRDRTRLLIDPMLGELDGPCPGQLYEVYDGDGWEGMPEDHRQLDPPQQPGGCPAQAWSVSEIRRVLSLIG